MFSLAFNDRVMGLLRTSRRHRRHHRARIAAARPCALLATLATLAGCADKTDAEFRTEVAIAMQASITQDLDDLVQAACNLQAAAPSRAWNPTTDRAAIRQMIDAWKRTRMAWERVEGAVAPLYPDLNATMDARYEELLSASGGDRNPFDGYGVVGMHAIERILFAPDIRPEVVAFERKLPGYRTAAYPSTDNEAIAFKFQLVQRLIDDAIELTGCWEPGDFNVGAAYQGLAGLMQEQQEKIDLAASGNEESRYANFTLFDLRNTLTGTEHAYQLFRGWIRTHASAERADQTILNRFMLLAQAYDNSGGDALPQVPADWSSEHPSPDALGTPFGTLWREIRQSVDPSNHGSVVYEMNRIAVLLGIP